MGSEWRLSGYVFVLVASEMRLMPCFIGHERVKNPSQTSLRSISAGSPAPAAVSNIESVHAQTNTPPISDSVSLCPIHSPTDNVYKSTKLRLHTTTNCVTTGPERSARVREGGKSIARESHTADANEPVQWITPTFLVDSSPSSAGTHRKLRVRRSTFVTGWAVPPRVLLIESY